MWAGGRSGCGDESLGGRGDTDKDTWGHTGRAPVGTWVKMGQRTLVGREVRTPVGIYGQVYAQGV